MIVIVALKLVPSLGRALRRGETARLALDTVGPFPSERCKRKVNNPTKKREANASRFLDRHYFASGPLRSKNILTRSIGTGKIVVELCSEATSVSVCR